METTDSIYSIFISKQTLDNRSMSVFKSWLYKDTYKKYLWQAYNGSTILYSILGLLMGWVSLWFWL